MSRIRGEGSVSGFLWERTSSAAEAGARDGKSADAVVMRVGMNTLLAARGPVDCIGADGFIGSLGGLFALLRMTSVNKTDHEAALIVRVRFARPRSLCLQDVG